MVEIRDAYFPADKLTVSVAPNTNDHLLLDTTTNGVRLSAVLDVGGALKLASEVARFLRAQGLS